MDTEAFRGWIGEAACLIAGNVDRLNELDAAIGDADHGANMRRGFDAALASLAETDPDTPGAVLATAGRALIRETGGTAGPLYGTLFRQAAVALGEASRIGGEELGAALDTALTGVRRLGGAAEGDKTMVDALAPAVVAYDTIIEAGGDLVAATRCAAEAAGLGLRATIPMRARKGRAGYLGDGTIGHQDPGAASVVLILQALATAAADHSR